MIEEKKMDLNERIAIKIMSKLPIDSEEDRIRYLKCKFGIQSMLVDIVKAFVVYFFAILLNMFIPVLLFQLGYLLIRTFGYGAHASNNIICTVSSVLVFIIVPYVLQHITTLSQYFLVIILIINFIIIFFYAPSTTDKNPIVDREKRMKLRNSTILLNLVILIFTLLNNNLLISNYIVLGSFIASLYMLPIAHIIFSSKGGRENEN